MSMRILILDDDENRHGKFAHWFAGYDVHHVYTIAQFEEKLGTGKFDAIFLDHDLNDYGKTSVVPGAYGPVELTGFDAAKMVSNLPDDCRPDQVVVHSWNPAGASMMVELLRDCGLSVIRWEFNPKSIFKIHG